MASINVLPTDSERRKAVFKKLMMDVNITTAAFAALVGKPLNTVNNWRRNSTKVAPSWSALLEMSLLFPLRLSVCKVLPYGAVKILFVIDEMSDEDEFKALITSNAIIARTPPLSAGVNLPIEYCKEIKSLAEFFNTTQSGDTV